MVPISSPPSSKAKIRRWETPKQRSEDGPQGLEDENLSFSLISLVQVAAYPKKPYNHTNFDDRFQQWACIPDHLWLPRQHQLPLRDRHLRGAVSQDTWSAELGGCNAGPPQFVGVKVWIMGSAVGFVIGCIFFMLLMMDVIHGYAYKICHPLCSISMIIKISIPWKRMVLFFSGRLLDRLYKLDLLRGLFFK